MDIVELYQDFISGMLQTTWYEAVAVFAGILSVWYSRRENILVYPVGLVNTILYVYLSFKGGLLGEASVNLYYTIMSIWGWMLWSKRDRADQPVVRIMFSSTRQWIYQLSFFAACYLVLFFALRYVKAAFFPGAIPWGDALASASAFTGMWLMAKKKVESWIWWIITNIASIPLYFVKGYVFTSVYYFVLLVMAIAGWIAWAQRAKANRHAY